MLLFARSFSFSGSAFLWHWLGTFPSSQYLLCLTTFLHTGNCPIARKSLLSLSFPLFGNGGGEGSARQYLAFLTAEVSFYKVFLLRFLVDFDCTAADSHPLAGRTAGFKCYLSIEVDCMPLTNFSVGGHKFDEAFDLDLIAYKCFWIRSLWLHHDKVLKPPITCYRFQC